MLTSGVKTIYRNPTYRERKVLFQITNGIITEDYLELTEVSTFDVQTNSGTAVSMGVKRGVIQPWYFGPYTINVTGKSYIGAYRDERINYNKDDDVNKLMQYSLMVKDSFLKGNGTKLGPPNSSKIILNCIDPKTPGLFFGISSQYEGYVDDIKYTEDEQNPFMLTYSIKFIGESYQAVNTDKGVAASVKDKAKLGASKVSGVSEPFGPPDLRASQATTGNSNYTSPATPNAPANLGIGK